MTKSAQTAFHVTVILAAAIALQVFFMCIFVQIAKPWDAWLRTGVFIGGSLINVALLITDYCAYATDREVVYKTCIITYVFLLFSAMTVYILLTSGFFAVVNDEEALEEFLKGAGTWMSILFIVLQFLQVVVLPIPSTVTVVAGSALFGPFWGSVFSLIGIFLGSLTAFFIGRYAGYRVVAWLVGRDTLDKWQKKLKGKDKLLISAMFLLPVFPDDVLCFVAGLSSMSLGLFTSVILISRILAIFMTSYSVSLIPFDTWWGILIWVLFAIAVTVLFVWLYRDSEKIENWINRKLHRESRNERKKQTDEFRVEIVDPDGTVVGKGVKQKNVNGE